MMNKYKEYELGKLLEYEQPNRYIVESTKYDDSYEIPVITAGKTFILGYTNEKENIFDKVPVIVFDDFTTATKFVNFNFKVKSSAMKILHINTDLVLPKYIFYRMQVIQFDHSTHKRYWIQHYSKIKVSVPPLEEQKHIIAKIEELFSNLDNSIAELTTAKEKLKIYRQAVLKEAFEGKWKNKEIKSIDLNNSLSYIKDIDFNLPQLPNYWRYIRLSELGDLNRGRSRHRPRNDKRLFENGKYPFFQTGDVKSASKYLKKCEKMYGDFGLAQSKLWPSGTLCITIAANIAETCFLGVDGCFPDSIVGFTPNKNLVNIEYIRYFIESSKLRLWAFAPATAQKNINLTTLENLIVPYCSIDMQNWIVSEIENRLSKCEVIEQTIEQSLQQAEALRQSILKNAFEGKL